MLVARRRVDGQFYRLTYDDGVDFIIGRAADAIWVNWSADRSLSDVPSLLLGPVIGILLRLRGLTSLHASAVAIDGRAVLFVGSQGAGKSTLAAAFATWGVPVLADDTIVLRDQCGTWMASPGYPRLRLWPAAAEAFVGRAGPLALMPPGASGSASRYHLDLTALPAGFQPDPLPIGAAYVLDSGHPGRSLSSGLYTPAQAVITLVTHTYSPRVLERDQKAEEFCELVRFVQQVPVRSLSAPRDLERLEDICAFVAEECRIGCAA
jgi:hypothetical protein